MKRLEKRMKAQKRLKALEKSLKAWKKPSKHGFPTMYNSHIT